MLACKWLFLRFAGGQRLPAHEEVALQISNGSVWQVAFLFPPVFLFAIFASARCLPLIIDFCQFPTTLAKHCVDITKIDE